MALANPYSRHFASTGSPTVPAQATVKSRSGNPTLHYQKAQVETASPTRLVIMLYEGAIRFCQVALDAMAAKDLPVQHENLLKAQRIVAHLLGSLEREKGGELAENLAGLYTHMLEQLVKANLYDEPELVQGVQSMLRDLWASWIEVERLTEAGGRDQGSGAREEQGKGEKDASLVSVQRPTPNTISSRLGGIHA